MNRLESIQRINYLLAVFRAEVEIASPQGLTDANHVAEEVSKEVLRIAWGLQDLENLNLSEGQDYPGIDLGDRSRRVAVQVTSESDNAKVKATLERAIDHNLDREFDELRILVLGKKQGRYTGAGWNEILQGRLRFGQSKVFDLSDVVQQVRELGDTALEDLRAYLESQFTPGLQQHLASLLDGPLGTSFEPWEEAWGDHVATSVLRPLPSLEGRENELERIVAWLEDPEIKVVVIAGPPGIGKTRLALEATKHRSDGTIVAQDPDWMHVGDLAKGARGPYETVVIVDEPESIRFDRLVRGAVAGDSIKLVVCVPSTSVGSQFNFGQDRRVQTMQLDPLSGASPAGLIDAVGAELDLGLRGWVLEAASGVPGLLLAAAAAGRDLRSQTGSLSEGVATALRERVLRDLGERALASLGVLSVLTSIGVDHGPRIELEEVGRRFGEARLGVLLQDLDRLKDAGFVVARGSYVEVVPALLGDALAASLLRGEEAYSRLLELMVVLPGAAQKRLVGRLIRLPRGAIDRFWDDLLGRDGPFASFEAALSDLALLRQVAAVEPSAVARLILDGLATLNAGARLELRGEIRRDLVWTLEHLLFRRASSALALEALSLLAEAENEDYGNNATGVFKECFHFGHPMLPLRLNERRVLLESLLVPGRSEAIRQVAVEAIETGLRGYGALHVLPSEGADPLDAPPPMTLREILEYHESLVDLLVDIAVRLDDVAGEVARQHLPRLLYFSAARAPSEAAINRVERVVDLVSDGSLALGVTDLVESMQLLAEALVEPPERRSVLSALPDHDRERLRNRVSALVSRFMGSGFGTRLKYWTGGHPRGGMERVIGEDGQETWRINLALEALAREVLENPELLTESLLEWLQSPEAVAARGFFFYLGKGDTDLVWRSVMRRAATEPRSTIAFGSYFGGVATHAPEGVSRLLDEVVASEEAAPEAVVEAMSWLAIDPTGIVRLTRLIRDGKVSGPHVSKRLQVNRWWQSLSNEELAELLQVVADDSLVNAIAVIEALAFRIHQGVTIDGALRELGWRCLLAATNVSGSDDYHFDEVAADLAPGDPDRAFEVLTELLEKDFRLRSWEPLGGLGRREHQFWSVLNAIDHERALRAALDGAVATRSKPRIGRFMGHVLGQDVDAELLVALGEESEGYAEAISGSLQAGAPGFWDVAVPLLGAYPDANGVWGNVDFALQMLGGAWGPMSAHAKEAADYIGQALEERSMPHSVRRWLDAKQQDLNRSAEIYLLREADEAVDGFGFHETEPLPGRRAWGLQVLLKSGRIERALAIAPRAELERIVDQLELGPDEARSIRDELNRR